MKPNQFISAVLVVACALLLPSGCEEQAAAPQQLNPNWFLQFEQLAEPAAPVAAVTTPSVRTSPRISFEKVVHDFGFVSPETSSFWEFRFSNAGTGTLKIEEIEKACGCTLLSLDKTEYAPGETGTLGVRYLADSQFGPTTKQLWIHSNDPTNPEVMLAINATIAAKVDYEPKALNLVLRQDNAGCPTLRLVSLDNQPFAITHFTSTGNSITADFDPAEEKTSFVLHPKVNMDSLERTLNGMIEIGLSHPECKKVTVSVNTLARFRVSPRSIIVRGAQANQPVVRTVRILNNYNEPFEMESTSSQNGTVRVLSNVLVNDGYELEIEITPPADRTRTFSETLYLKMKDGRQLEISCSIFYSGATSAAASESAQQSKECKVCGPRLIDPETGAVTIHRTTQADKGS
ncbi:MAG TPA: DUF1573 domain-containing protein [Sedimentisphaerales bacterium]|nr:DUF1573 domain-containing protein [Sedimentisphaerales bacterium]